MLTAAWVLAIVLVNPSGNFPINDDWSYADTVRRLVERGEWQLNPWTSMPLGTQVVWGWLFSQPAGFSFNALRMSTLVLAWAATLGIYALLRIAGVGPLVAWLSAATLAVCPVFFPLAFTFMTDVPALALGVWALVCVLKYIQSRRLEYLAGALLITWLAATLNFFIPRLSGQNPIRERLLEQALVGGYVHVGMNDMVAEYEQRFGLDQPLWIQYFRYLGDVSRGDFNYSIANYPRTVVEMMAEALPWTIGLLGTTTLLSFVLGTLLGAFMGWPRVARVPEVRLAAAPGAPRDPVLPARARADVLLHLPVPDSPEHRRLHGRPHPGPEEHLVLAGRASLTPYCPPSRSSWRRSAAGRWRCGRWWSPSRATTSSPSPTRRA